MNAVAAVSRQYLRGVLPYPDLLRRRRIRRAALRLVTCEEWPGADATGTDAAQLALLRLLWLQRLTRNAVSERRAEEAALLARAALETCIVGLYCVHSGDSIAYLSAANYRTAGQAVSYLSDGDLRSRDAVVGAVDALGELGPDLDIRDLALWLDREHELAVAASLYYTYYVPLSHLFSHAYAFALMRHVRPDGAVRRRATFPWAARSAVRLADACTGLLAANIADKSGTAPEPFLRYATAHLDRVLAPALVFTVKGALRSSPRRKFPGRLAAILEKQHVDGPGRSDDPVPQDVPVQASDAVAQDAGTDGGLEGFFDPPLAQAPDGMFDQPADEYTGGMLAQTNYQAGEAAQARHRRSSTG
jgi:hypothetical protein